MAIGAVLGTGPGFDMARREISRIIGRAVCPNRRWRSCGWDQFRPNAQRTQSERLLKPDKDINGV